MNIRQDTAKHIREVRKILQSGRSEPLDREPQTSLLNKWLFALGITGLILIGSCEVVHAQDVDLNKISRIESDGDTHAYNYRTGAIGAYQILPGVVQDYNEADHLTKEETEEGNLQISFTVEQMYSYYYSSLVADWYLNHKIPEYLKHYGIPDTTTSRLIAYNWGIGHLRHWFNHGSHWSKLPLETRNYIKKYFRKDKA